ncbi:hypothetical protein CDD83_3474 [Cordyceps sp. RAO-2017]|nr:hypothetical protein CDD83_3474 [Cordyceps sp. RAO-2017]
MNIEHGDIKLANKATNLFKRAPSWVPASDRRTAFWTIYMYAHFDQARRKPCISQFTGLLLEQLRLTKERPRLHDALKLGLPRQFVLKILDSIEVFLVPLSYKMSRKLLQSRFETLDLNPDILRPGNRDSGRDRMPPPFQYCLVDLPAE